MMDHHTSYFVEAGAGSGKTTRLVHRMVSMVEAGIDVSEICAITFTKAAAAEFYSRFQKLLIERSVERPADAGSWETAALGASTDETRARCQKALENIDLCFMGTIDAFCNMLVREHPAEAKVPSDASIIDTAEQAELIRREYKRIQTGAFGAEAKRLNQRFIALSYSRDIENEFAAITQTMMERRDTAFVLPPVPDELTQLLTEGDLADAMTKIKALVSALHANRHAKFLKYSYHETAWETIEKHARLFLSPWREKNLRDLRRELRKITRISFAAGIDIQSLGPVVSAMFQEGFRTKKDTKPERYDLNDDARQLLEQTAVRLQDYEYAVAANLAAGCLPQIAETLRREGLLTYFDYKLCVRDMLREDAGADGALIRHISARHRYFLLDEFQDTDPMQFEIFFYLAAENPVPDWRSCVPRRGALFVVGDPKQSIYRFKGANIASYLSVRELFDSAEAKVMPLKENHRSENELKEWFNKVFGELMPEDSADQSKFDEIPVDEAKRDTSDSFRGVYRFDGCGGDPAEVADMIQNLVYHDTIRIRYKDEAAGGYAGRPIQYGDIMLITTRKKPIANYVRQFYEQKIPYRVEGDLSFGECPALVLAAVLYKAVAVPHDARWFYGALLSAPFSVTEKQVTDLKNQGVRISIFTELPDGVGDPAVREAFVRLRKDRSDAIGLMPSALLGRIIEDYDLFSCAGTDNLEYLYYAMELLRSEESTGGIASLADGAVFLDRLLCGESDTERCFSLTKTSDCVHIANLHKIKGLEAPVVILAADKKYRRTPSVRSEYTGANPRSWFFRFESRSETRQEYVSTGQYPDQEEEEACSAEAEYLRLLYVAATRAKNALIIGWLKDKKGNPLGSNYWLPLLEYCSGDLYDRIPAGDAFAPEPDTVEIGSLYEDNDYIDLSACEAVAGETYVKQLPSTLPKVRTKAEKDNPDTADETAPAGNGAGGEPPSGGSVTGTRKGDPKVMGTMIHSFMEAMVSSRGTADPEDLVTELISSYRDDLTPGVDYHRILTEVASTILSGGYPKQEPGVPADILAELLAAEEVLCELPFCYAEPAADGAEGSVPVVWQGVIDVAYRKDRAWHILDYKTNYENDHLGEMYSLQLQQYQKAFRTIAGEEADARIYSIPV